MELFYNIWSICTFLLLISPFYGSAQNSSMMTWGYQLQDYGIDELIESNFDILVIDYSKDGSDENKFTNDEIQKIKHNKKVIAYISIGEAEEYRYYFNESWYNNPPEWLHNENSQWEGNYKVKYWHQEWQSIIFDYIDTIVSQNFDGIYLDIIDAYQYFEDSVPNSVNLMIEFVMNISNYVKSNSDLGNNYMVIPQNAEELLINDTYRASIDGIGKEDLYVNPETEHKNDELEIEYSEELLDLLITEDKLVMVVDYSQHKNTIKWAKERSMEHGYIHYAGVLELDQLVDQSRFDPLRIKFIVILVPILIIVPIYFVYRSRRN